MGQILAVSAVGYPAGTIFVIEPSDHGAPLTGTLDLTTGVITPIANHLIHTKGLIYVSPDGAESVV